MIANLSIGLISIAKTGGRNSGRCGNKLLEGKDEGGG